MFKLSSKLLADKASAAVKGSTDNLSGFLKIYYWPPKVGQVTKPHPALAYGIGNLGHLSLYVKYSDGKNDYLSVWERQLLTLMPGPSGEDYRIADLSKALEDDIESEGELEPKIKSIEITPEQERQIKAYIEGIKARVNAVENPLTWTLSRNCSTFVFEALEAAKLIHREEIKILPMTPAYVFDRFMNQQEIEELKIKSQLGLSPSQE